MLFRSICKACEEKTVMMCDKLETLLAQSSKTIANKANMSLEDMFGNATETASSKILDTVDPANETKIDQTTTGYNFTMSESFPGRNPKLDANASNTETLDIDAILASTQNDEVDSLGEMTEGLEKITTVREAVEWIKKTRSPL